MALDASVAHVLGRLDVLRLRVAAVVAARRAVDTAPDDPFLGLYLSDEKIDHILRNDRVWVGADVAADRLAAVEAAADAAAGARPPAAGARRPLRPRRRRRRHPPGRDGARRRRPVRALLRLPQRRRDAAAGQRRSGARVSPPSMPRTPAAGVASKPGARSSAAALVEIEDPDRPFLTRAVRVPDRVTAHVLGADEPDAALAVRCGATSSRPASRRTTRWREPCGRRRRSCTCTTATASPPSRSSTPRAAVGLPVVVIDLDRLDRDADAGGSAPGGRARGPPARRRCSSPGRSTRSPRATSPPSSSSPPARSGSSSSATEDGIRPSPPGRRWCWRYPG